MTAGALVQQTIVYKVGHYASHTPTRKPNGLEAMTRDDLMALIPVDQTVALNRTPKWSMLADKLYARLMEKTHGRVLRSDIGRPPDSDRPASVTSEEWAAARADPNITVAPLSLEYRLV